MKLQLWIRKKLVRTIEDVNEENKFHLFFELKRQAMQQPHCYEIYLLIRKPFNQNAKTKNRRGTHQLVSYVEKYDSATESKNGIL